MDKICLKINQLDIREYFIKLREDQNLFDVTLATDDGQHIQAHKMVLSAGSHFFNDAFLKSNNHSNMLIYLKGITNPQLEPVMDFLYNGEAFLAQEEVKEFLKTGKELQIKGLEGELGSVSDSGEEAKANTNNDDTEFESTNVNNRRNIVPGPSNATDEVTRMDDEFEKDHKVEENTFSNLSENGQFKGECLQNYLNVKEIMKGITDSADEIADKVKVSSTNDLNDRIRQMIEKKEEVWECKECGKTKSRKGHIIQHAETHIGGMSHACHLCGKTFSTRPTLHNHTSTYHSFKLYSCEICGRSDMNRQAFYMHKRNSHNKNTL